MGDLKSKAKSGFVWSALERFSSQGIIFLFSIILARLLSPEEYGLMAIPLVILSVAQCFVDSGFSSALIRKKDILDSDLSTAFYFNLLVGVLCFVVIWFLSPWISVFYDNPKLTDLIRVTGLSLLFTPLTVVQQAVMSRNIDFKSQAIAMISSALLSGCLGVALAILGYGVWSLVYQQVGACVFRTLFLWLIGNWRPKSGWNSSSFKYLWSFGSKILASGLLNTIYNNIFPIVIGKKFSEHELGTYVRAQQFSELPSSNLTGILQRVTFPLFSTIQDDDTLLRNNYRRILKLSAFVIFPIMIGISSLAHPLVELLLGNQWVETAPILQILCISFMWYPIHAINLNLLQVKGYSNIFLRLEIIKKIIGVLILCFTIPKGILCMASGTILSGFISLFINTYYTGKLINVGFVAQLKDLSGIFVANLFLFLLVFSFIHLFSNLYLQLISGTIVGVVYYLIVSHYFFKNELNEFINFLPKKITNIFNK